MGTRKKKSKGNKPIKRKQFVSKRKGKQDDNIDGIVRMCNNDLDGYTPIGQALWGIRGVGPILASVLTDKVKENMGFSAEKLIGSLSEKEIDQLEELIKNPAKYGVPEFMLNRRKDPITGETKHLIGNDIVIALRTDKKRLTNIKSWVGMRHQTRKGKVRGQRTRNTGRGHVSMGVIRKSVQNKMGGADKKKPKKK